MCVLPVRILVLVVAGPPGTTYHLLVLGFGTLNDYNSSSCMGVITITENLNTG